MAFGLVVSALTDYRISLAKIIPDEVHETFDYLLGGAIIAMPFVVGFVTTVPQVAALHFFGGVFLIVEALFTDYRAFRRR
jgi:hypothetical protein